MKNRSKSLSIILIGIIAIFSTSCKVASTSMQVLVPAEIYVPTVINKVVIVNRSLPQKDQKALNILEGLITGESIFADRDGSMNCIRGLANHLNANPRFQAVLLETLDLRGTGTREFAAPLDWAQVESICKQNGADALVSLETFDSNIGIRESNRNVTKKVDGKDVVSTVYRAEMMINVNAGWRIYDYKNRRIVDQNSFMDEKGWNGEGSSPKDALNRLPNKRNAINEAGFYAGGRYGIRISPSWMTATRQYYIKGDDNLKESKRFVNSKDWTGAAAIWNPLTTNADPKIAGRACYNMALACEMDGNLEAAKTWAEKAYKQYGLKKGLPYVNILTTRIMQQEKLKEQMEGK